MIRGKTSLIQGQTLNLSCSHIQTSQTFLVWSQPGSDIILGNGTDVAFLLIPNVTSQESGRYECRAKQHALSAFADVTVIDECEYKAVTIRTFYMMINWCSNN